MGVDPYGLLTWDDFRTMGSNYWHYIGEGYDAVSGGVHIVLDVAGLVPAIGEAADLVNGVLYGIEGDLINMGISLAAMVPVVGWGAIAAKYGLRGIPWNAIGGAAVFGWVRDAVLKGWRAIPDFMVRGGGFGKRGCFIAGTLVLTASGPVPIEEVQAGDEVWSYNIETQEWELCEVIEPQVREYDGLILTLTIAAEDGSTETIECTDEHPFWITAGKDLSQRPVVQALAPHDREMTVKSHGGRWIAARWLRIGDHFLTRAGKSATVSGQTIGNERVKVYNLNVNELHFYAVGDAGVLVHNSGWRWGPPKYGNKPNRWIDPAGGEWRWHKPDKYHAEGHWDYNPRYNSSTKWQQIYEEPGGQLNWSWCEPSHGKRRWE